MKSYERLVHRNILPGIIILLKLLQQVIRKRSQLIKGVSRLWGAPRRVSGEMEETQDCKEPVPTHGEIKHRRKLGSKHPGSHPSICHGALIDERHVFHQALEHPQLLHRHASPIGDAGPLPEHLPGSPKASRFFPLIIFSLSHNQTHESSVKNSWKKSRGDLAEFGILRGPLRPLNATGHPSSIPSTGSQSVASASGGVTGPAAGGGNGPASISGRDAGPASASGRNHYMFTYHTLLELGFLDCASLCGNLSMCTSCKAVSNEIPANKSSALFYSEQSMLQ